MRTFEPDPTALLTPTTSLPSPAQCGNSLRFNTPALHLKVGQGWETWSHGYTGDVYSYFDQTAAIILLPQGTRAFYFYTEPNVYSNYTAEPDSSQRLIRYAQANVANPCLRYDS